MGFTSDMPANEAWAFEKVAAEKPANDKKDRSEGICKNAMEVVPQESAGSIHEAADRGDPSTVLK